MSKSLRAAAMAAGLAAAWPAQALDGLGVDLGSGDESATLASLSLRWNWERKWFAGGDWYLGGYWELDAGHWSGRAGTTGNRNVSEIGLTPVFRLQPQRQEGVTPWIEAAIGFHLLSEHRIGDKNLATGFQFGDHVGAGLSFGAKRAFEIGYRFQHFSNGGIKHPNPGINFHMIRVQSRF